MLGDFKTNTTHPQSATKAALTTSSTQTQFDAITDYAYDVNGNLIVDNYKAITSITYNHLNLPSVITVIGKGSITYTYDATGNKLKKQTSDITTSGKTIVTTTTYIAGFVYESKQTTPINTPNDDYTDVLQFTDHEEGRIRRKTDGSFLCLRWSCKNSWHDRVSHTAVVVCSCGRFCGLASTNNQKGLTKV